jgi:predicted nucleic acid-binding protein
MSDSFLDTNIVLYSLSNDMVKYRCTLLLLAKQPILSLQVLNEAANVMRRKEAIRSPLQQWRT